MSPVSAVAQPRRAPRNVVVLTKTTSAALSRCTVCPIIVRFLMLLA